MDPRTIAGQYYDAWAHRAGDMTDVPLAERFSFTGPVADFTDAGGYREMTRQAGAAVRRFEVRHQFVSGDLVCSIVDWQMDPLPGTLTAAELLRIRDGEIVAGELIYDAEDLRRVLAGASGPSGPSGSVGSTGPAGPADPVESLRRGYAATAELIGQVPVTGWAAPSGCGPWTVRQVGNHLAGGLGLITRVAEGRRVDPAEFDAQAQAGTDHLGADPAAAFQAVTERSLAVFAKPDTMAREFPFTTGTAPGAVLASISMLESLIHGWDIAQAAGLGHAADDDVVDAVWTYARRHVGEAQRRAGLFAAAIPVLPAAGPFSLLLAHLGRQP